MKNLSKDELEVILEGLAMLNNKCRIEGLETLVRNLNKELWTLRRSTPKISEGDSG